MMKFVGLLRGGHSIFKKIRVGFTLLKSSFKAVFFNHQRYFFLCIVLAGIQFIHLKIAGFIHYRLSMGVLMAELLSGENFFEILWHDARLTISAQNFWVLSELIVLIYLEIVLIFFALCSVAHYTVQSHEYRLSWWESLQASLRNWKAICIWGFVELCLQGFSSFLGGFGALLYFAWNILTIFDVQILAFDRFGAYHVLKKSWKLFIQTFSEIIVLDVIIEGLLVIIGLGIYFMSKQYIPNISPAELGSYNDMVLFLILYVVSSVMIFEVVVFTRLYQSAEK